MILGSLCSPGNSKNAVVDPKLGLYHIDITSKFTSNCGPPRQARPPIMLGNVAQMRKLQTIRHLKRASDHRSADHTLAPATDLPNNVLWTVSRNKTVSFLPCEVKNAKFNQYLPVVLMSLNVPNWRFRNSWCAEYNVIIVSHNAVTQ